MDTEENKLKQVLRDQEVRITAAIQLLICAFAVVAAVSGELRRPKKKKKKKK